MKNSRIKFNVSKKQSVVRPTGPAKQSEVVRGVVEDNGPPSALYTTCPPIDVDDVAERNSEDDAAELVAEFDDFGETDEETVGVVDGGGD